MSLINKMLSGLDKRGVITGAEDPDPALEELCPVEEEELAHRPAAVGGWLFILCLAAAAILAVYFYTGSGSSSGVEIPPQERVVSNARAEANDNTPEASVKTPADPAAGGQETVPQLPEELALRLDAGLNVRSAGSPVPDTGSVRIQQVRARSDAGVLVIDVLLPQDIHYTVYTLQQPHRLVLELSNARYAGSLPGIEGLPGIRAVRQNIRNDGTYVLVLEGRTAFEIGNSELARTEQGYRLQLQALTTGPGAEPAAVAAGHSGPDTSRPGSFTKSPSVPVTGIVKRNTGRSASPVEALLYEGRQLYDEGDVEQGLEKIFSAVEQHPEHVRARSTLALLLLEQGRDGLASEILVRGLRQQPETPEWAMILGRTLYTDGNPQQARVVLEEAAPAVTGNADYHSLYAGILQALGEHARAVVVYRNLLEQHGDNGAWWLGLGISLDAMARKADAIIAYRNALNNPGINGDSRDYIRNRLTDLEQQT